MEKPGKLAPEIRLSGQIVIDQLVRNMELGRFEMAYSVLVPCIFSIYLHPEDHARLAGILDLIREDARRALAEKLEQWNAKPFRFGAKKDAKTFKIAGKDFTLEFFPDSEGTVPIGDVEIHSELNETPQPGYHGVKTTLLDREPSVRDSRDDSIGHAIGPPAPERSYGEIRYEDDSGPQLFVMTQSEIAVGRGGDDLHVHLALYTNDEVSREHLRIRHDPARGFLILDKSRNGTWVDGKRIRKGVDEKLPAQAEIGIAEVLTLRFEGKR
jgi:hypothetical protein